MQCSIARLYAWPAGVSRVASSLAYHNTFTSSTSRDYTSDNDTGASNKHHVVYLIMVCSHACIHVHNDITVADPGGGGGGGGGGAGGPTMQL